MSRRLNYLRIAFSAVCGILCLLLIASWAESYRDYGEPYGLLYKPYLLRVLLTFAGATVPWISWRFSLRTLLIGMTLVAAVLGAVVWAVR